MSLCSNAAILVPEMALGAIRGRFFRHEKQRLGHPVDERDAVKHIPDDDDRADQRCRRVGQEEVASGGPDPAEAGGRELDRKSTRLNSSHVLRSRMPSSA